MNDLISRQAERMSELKPCPFCGAPAVHWEWNGGARVDCSKWMSDGAAVNTHFVGIGAKTFEEAAKLWNERKDAQPERKKGRWIHDGEDIPHGVDWMHCSVCGRREPHVPAAMTNFCPNCGADMRGEQDATD